MTEVVEVTVEVGFVGGERAIFIASPKGQLNPAVSNRARATAAEWVKAARRGRVGHV